MLEARSATTETIIARPQKSAQKAPQTFHDWQISPMDFARDYFDGEKLLKSYGEISTLPDGHIGPAEGAKMLGYVRNNKVDYSRICANIKQWKNLRKDPRLIQALIKLHVIGIFSGKDDYKFDSTDTASDSLFDPDSLENFTFANPNFEAICFIASLEFWQGSLNKIPGNFSTKKTVITPTRYKKAVTELLKSLGIDFNGIAKKNGLGLPNYISRLLSLMGSPLGRKSKHRDNFPEHVKMALNSLNSITSTPEERQRAQTVIDDFVLIFIVQHCYQKKQAYVGSLIGCREPAALERQKELFTETIKSSSIDVRVSLKDQPHRSIPSAITKLEGVKSPEIEKYRRQFRKRIQNLMVPKDY